MTETRLSFKDMCAKFDVTPRTLRYYEYIELLSPLKEGRARFYGPREVARMTLILRGRRFGFSLEEIRQWLLIYGKKGEKQQLEEWLQMADRQLAELDRQRAELDTTIDDLRALRGTAHDELSRLTQYYYNVVYVTGGEQSPSEIAAIGNVRRWLESHKFPPGFVAPSSEGLGATLDTFKQGGWATMKTGIVRTRSSAEMLLQHRFEVVVVPELPKGEMPRKAKAAKEWKDVRKKL